MINKIFITNNIVVIIVLAILSFPFVRIESTNRLSKAKQSKTNLLPFDKDVKVGKLPNGFTYYIRKNIEPKNRVTLYLANKVGSILETNEQLGLAHFMEHMSFNGTKHFPRNELVSYLQKSGVRFGSDLNAYTSFDETVYQLPLPTDNAGLLKNGFQIMRDWAQDALLDSTEIDKERGVILEEKRLGKSAQQRLQFKYFPVLLNQSRYANRLPIGTEDVLTTFKKKTLLDFYQDWYRPDLQALIVVGDIDVTATEQVIKSLFSDLKMPLIPRQRIGYKVSLTGENQFFVATDKELPVSLIQVFIKHTKTPLKTTSDFRRLILCSLYNHIIGERLNDLSKQANSPYIQASSSINDFLSNLDASSTTVVCKSGEIESGFTSVWSEIERVKRFGFTQSELDRAKQAVENDVKSAFNEKDKTASDKYVKQYLSCFLKGNAIPGIDYEYKFYKKTLPEITLLELNELIQEYLADTNRDILVMGPDKEAKSLPTEFDLESWMANVRKSKIVPLVDKAVNMHLLDKKPIAGKIIHEQKNEVLGLTELTLSNGVKVNLKSTNFKNDEIRFQAFSSGGTSLYNDADYESATRASELIKSSGVAAFNQAQLEKYLTGKKVNVSPYINERFEGFTGFSSPDEIETALQLIYLYVTQARKDDEVYSGILSRERSFLFNRGNDPATVFADSVSSVLGNYNVRRTGPSIEKLDKINIDRAFEIYKERFADVGDFIFTFVGNFDLEKIKPLLEQYLGALPSNGRVENAHDLGIHIPGGKIEKRVSKGIDQKAAVRLVFSGTYNYSDEENSLLSALSELATIKLLERLRENESGVYGVGARVSYSKYPQSRYSFSISFGCAPINVEKLISATLDVLHNIKENLPLQTDVDKVTSEDLRTTETQLKENGFWLNYLCNQFQNNENPLQILSYQETIKRITPAALKAAANKYLDDTNFIRLILYPDKQ